MASRKPSQKKRAYGTQLKPQKGENPENRPFLGREKKLSKQTQLSALLTATLDILARFRATQEPIQKIVTPILKQRRFGSRERNDVKDWIFALQRQKTQLEQQLNDCIQKVGGVPPSRRQKDLALILATMNDSQRERYQKEAGNLLSTPLTLFLDGLPTNQETPRFPAWLQEKVKLQFGSQAAQIEKSFLEKASPAFAMSTKNISRDELLLQINASTEIAQPFAEIPDGFWCSSHFPLSRLPEELQGEVWPMDLGSQLIAHLLNVQEGDDVLDMCAGGGGKTKALLRYTDKLTATDISQPRITAAQKRTRKDASVVYHCLDMTQPQFSSERFDRILVDAPCSGVGTIRRHPDILERLKPEELEGYATIQKDLLRQAEYLCRKNGFIIYATCSFVAEENEDIAAWAQEELSLEPVSLNTMKADNVLAAHDLQKHTMYFLPHEFQSDGFFVAAFQKK